jgi:hypothetical protein
MIEIQCKIEGTVPLMCHAFGNEAAIKASSRKSATFKGAKDKAREIAEKGLYLKDGKPVIPQTNMLRCIADGGFFHKAGKKQVTTKDSSLVYSCVELSPEFIPIIHTRPWEVWSGPIVNQNTKGRVLAYRPIFYDWALKFKISLDDTVFDADFLRDIVDDAGKKAGLGSWRPARKGPYGRFKVVLWDVKEIKLPEYAEAAE